MDSLWIETYKNGISKFSTISGSSNSMASMLTSFSTFSDEFGFSPLSQDISCDVCIIGGGIFGMTCAYYLTKLGYDVVILEKDDIGSKTSGHTTAKITSQHGLIYKHLIDDYGDNFARLYLDSNEKAITNIKNIIDKEKISCDFSYQNSYVYSTNPEDLPAIHDEVNALKSLGFPCEFAATVGLPFDTVGSVCFKNQAQFHPIKYLAGLCKNIKNSARIFTHTTVTDVKQEDTGYLCFATQSPVCMVTDDIDKSNYSEVIDSGDNKSTQYYGVKSKYVICASHYPFVNFPGFYFTKMYQSTSYLIAIDPKKSLFNGMFLSASNPTFSFRTCKTDVLKLERDLSESSPAKQTEAKELLIIGGSDHKTGRFCNESSTYKVLEDIAKKYYPDCEVLYRWNSRDCISLDKIPYIGQYALNTPDFYVGTGFKKWGMTLSNVAANIVVDMITGKENPYAEIYSSSRLKPVKNMDEFKNMMSQTTKSLLVDKIKKSHLDFEEIPVNSGGILEINGQKVGIYRNENDEIFAVKPVCTHLGCLLSWNDVDKTWDCPCHGSRFDYMGRNLYDPAFKDLEVFIVQ